MTLLDTVAEWVRRTLSALSPTAAEFLWFPVFVVVLFVMLMVLFRKGLPVGGRILTAVLRWVVTVAGAAMLLLDLAVATAFRWLRARPPSLVYGYGDVVASSVVWLTGAVGATTTAFGRAAKTHVLVVMICCAALGWSGPGTKATVENLEVGTGASGRSQAGSSSLNE